MSIDFSSAARKELKRLPASVQARVLAKLTWVDQDLDRRLEYLKGGLPKIRVGEYRILCHCVDGTLFVNQVYHRREAYDEKRHD